MRTPRKVWSGVAALLAVPLVLYALRPISDFDVWHHLRTGEQIVTEGRIPTQDVFSHTLDGGRFLVDSWLANLGFYAVWKGFGLLGVRVLNGILMAGLLGLLWWFVGTQQREPCVRLPTFLAAAVLVTPFVTWRPQILSIIMMVALYSSLTDPAAVARDRRRLALLVAGFCLWANLHPIVIAALVLYGVGLAGAWLGWLVSGRVSVRFRPSLTRRDLGRGALVGVLLLGATLCNANTYQIHKYAVHGTLVSRTAGLHIQEWASPIPFWRAWARDRLLGLNWSSVRPVDLDVVVSLLVLAVVLFGWRRAVLVRREVNPARLAVSVACVFLALSMSRCLWLLVFPLVEAASTLSLTTQRRVRCAWACAAAMGLAVTLATVSRIQANQALSARATSPYFPKALCDFVAAARLEGKLFNPYNWGGYLIYRLYPSCKTFIDGRNIDYQWNDPEIIADYLRARRGGLDALSRVLDAHDVDVIITTGARFRTSPSHLIGESRDRALAAAERDCVQVPPEGWVCVFVNREGVVFLRAGDQKNMRQCAAYYRSFGAQDSDWRPFRPAALIAKSPRFARRFSLVDDGYYKALATSDVQSLLTRARALAAVSAGRSAAELYEHVLTIDGTNREALLGASRMRHLSDQVDVARRLATRANELYATDAEVTRLFHHLRSSH